VKPARRIFPLFLTALWWSAAAASASPTVQLKDIRLHESRTEARLTLTLSSDLYTIRGPSSSDALQLIRLQGVAQAPGCRVPAPGKGLVRGIQLAREAGSLLVLKVSTSGPCRAQISRQKQRRGKPALLVIDLRPLPRPRTPAAGAGRIPGPAAPTPPKSPAVAPAAGGKPAGRPGGGPAGQAAAAPSPLSGEKAAAPSPSPVEKASAQAPRVIVIDAGHGGSDPGAVRSGLEEKQICLDVARRLAAALQATPGYQILLTRDRDVFLPLRERPRLAALKDADLFVSLHVNAAPDRKARGAEVYFLSLGGASDAASIEVARLENAADPAGAAEGDSALAQIPFLVDLRQSDTLLRSSRAAESVLDLLTSRKLAEPRGVKQAGFAVLKSYHVPSILCELGFVSSEEDRRALQDADHRERLAEAVADGVRLYFQRYAPHRDGTPP
jgi:N-acetylmuramoyl-L-alanine amidase